MTQYALWRVKSATEVAYGQTVLAVVEAEKKVHHIVVDMDTMEVTTIAQSMERM